MKRFVVLLCTILILLITTPAIYAQSDDDWRELRTERFAILYTEGNQQVAEYYEGFVDSIYDEVTGIFNHSADTPITLRLYPTLERYYEINPAARQLTGVVAHADFRRNEVVVILPQTEQQTPDEVQNNIRHELSHIVMSDISDDRLNVLFHEGIAQYVEHPSRELEAKIRLLQTTVDTDNLVRWSDLDDRDTFYTNAQVTYPQSLSIVAFLVEQHSFDKMRELLDTTARSSGYRSSLERTFGVSPDSLEQEWRAWLPEYLAGGYRRNALTAYDLTPIEEMLEQGRYSEAQQDLEQTIEWLGNTDQTDVLGQAQTLLEQSTQGQSATQLAEEARSKLEASDFTGALESIQQAQNAYTAIGDTRQNEVLTEYAERAERGIAAETRLRDATTLVQTWRYPQARAEIDHAAAEFSALGATGQLDQIRQLRATMDERQSLIGALLLMIGAVGLVGSVWRRLTVREAEAW
ncbi:MAG: peptidase MA family metallohydrolase [Chloroflexota bacterium]